MKENLLQQLYSGLLKLSPLRRQHKYEPDPLGNCFPSVGFLSDKLKLEFEKEFCISINNTALFEQALTHRSYLQVISSNELFYSNERLEFLGDSILGMIIAEYLFSYHSDLLEGQLSKMRSWLVNKKSLALCAHKLNLEKYLKLSYSASKSLERGSESILSDALEAVIGAIYLDSGLNSAKDFILNKLLPILLEKSVMVDKNFKSILLESVQGSGKPAPTYSVLEENGPDHDKEFQVAVWIEDKIVATGSGKSKKDAEQVSARNALEVLEIIPPES